MFRVKIKAKGPSPEPVCITPFFKVKGDPNGPYLYGLYVNDSGVCG